MPAYLEYVAPDHTSDELFALKEQLQLEKEKLQDIINTIPGGMAVYSISDKVQTVYFSQGVAALTGYMVSEYEAFAYYDALETVYSEDCILVEQGIQKLMVTHATHTFEFRNRHKDGHTV